MENNINNNITFDDFDGNFLFHNKIYYKKNNSKKI